MKLFESFALLDDLLYFDQLLVIYKTCEHILFLVDW